RVPPQPAAGLPALTGRCRASIPRWFFNASSGSCERFVFGGCGGNGNNFGSERECRASCGPAPGPAPSSPAATNATFADDPGTEFRRFFSSKGALLGGLLAAGGRAGLGAQPRAPPLPEEAATTGSRSREPRGPRVPHEGPLPRLRPPKNTPRPPPPE
ncbi:papilin-like, partial [Corvus hawaiiensis]|uniref:papilin-like n=1 Tax=Corvus hawaiiensis TaxID=134902 RepID=UPI002019B860